MPTLADQFFAMREAMLASMAGLTKESHVDDIRRSNGRWKRYRTEVAKWCVSQSLAGAAVRHFGEVIFTDPRWKHFKALRTLAWHRRPEVKEVRRKYDRDRYEKSLKARRSTPEARARLNEQRRARYARKVAEVTT